MTEFLSDNLWCSSKTYIFTNPRSPDATPTKLLNTVPGHLWISTSGTSQQKWVGLSKEAMLCSAQSVNEHLGCTQDDIWINPLPHFHVGGLSIYARAFLSHSQVLDLHKWDPKIFCSMKGTLASLVPTQVYDLVRNELHPPKSLRAVIVGGSALSDTIREKGLSLGWPILRSYGMSECSSQIATEKHPNSGLKLLNHVFVESRDGKLAIKSPALLSYYAINNELIDPKEDGWFVTDDFGKVNGTNLEIYGRQGDYIKIGGEGVYLPRLQGILDEVKLSLSIDNDMVLYPHPDERLGHVIHLICSGQRECHQLIELYQKRVHPFEKIRQIKYVDQIPRTPLGKLNLDPTIFK